MFTAQRMWARSSATRALEVVPLGVLTTIVVSQSGAPLGTRFWKNDLPLGAVGEALHEGGAPAHRAHERLGDGLVVADQVELGLAPLGEEDLVGAGDADGVARHLELDHLLGRHGAHGRGGTGGEGDYLTGKPLPDRARR